MPRMRSDEIADNSVAYLQDALRNRRQTQNDKFDQAKSMVAMQEAGYSYDPQKNTISPTEQFGQVPEGYTKFGGKMMPDRSVDYQRKILEQKELARPEPKMNELQRFTLEEKQRKVAADAQAQADRDAGLKESAQSNLETIGEVKKGLKFFGPAGNLPTIMSPSSLQPGGYGERANWEANVGKLLSGKVIDVMTAMKQSSKTGASGFGQLSEKELKVLQEASTALKRNLMPQDAEKYLNELEIIHQKVLGKTGGFGGGAQAPQFGQPSQGGGDEMVMMTAQDGSKVPVHRSRMAEAQQDGLK